MKNMKNSMPISVWKVMIVLRYWFKLIFKPTNFLGLANNKEWVVLCRCPWLNIEVRKLKKKKKMLLKLTQTLIVLVSLSSIVTLKYKNKKGAKM
jgi:hypothetical protein